MFCDLASMKRESYNSALNERGQIIFTPFAGARAASGLKSRSPTPTARIEGQLRSVTCACLAVSKLGERFILLRPSYAVA